MIVSATPSILLLRPQSWNAVLAGGVIGQAQPSTQWLGLRGQVMLLLDMRNTVPLLTVVSRFRLSKPQSRQQRSLEALRRQGGRTQVLLHKQQLASVGRRKTLAPLSNFRSSMSFSPPCVATAITSEHPPAQNTNTALHRFASGLVCLVLGKLLIVWLEFGLRASGNLRGIEYVEVKKRQCLENDWTEMDIVVSEP